MKYKIEIIKDLSEIEPFREIDRFVNQFIDDDIGIGFKTVVEIPIAVLTIDVPRPLTQHERQKIEAVVAETIMTHMPKGCRVGRIVPMEEPS